MHRILGYNKQIYKTKDTGIDTLTVCFGQQDL
jgi:hypothetical protein